MICSVCSEDKAPDCFGKNRKRCRGCINRIQQEKRHANGVRPMQPLHVRFWEKVDKRGPDECWPWLGAVRSNSRGLFGSYGVIWHERRNWQASHLAWELANGPVPDGMLIRHVVCDNPNCVNVAHLAVGTQKENMADKSAKLRQNGESHPMSKLNDAAVRDIRARSAAGEGHASIALRYGVTTQNINYIVKRTTWRHVA